MIRHAIFALSVVLIGSVDSSYDPRTLVIEWADGQVERIPATNQQVCNEAVKAVAHGWWAPDSSRAMLSIGCQKGNIFPKDEAKIRGRK